MVEDLAAGNVHICSPLTAAPSKDPAHTKKMTPETIAKPQHENYCMDCGETVTLDEDDGDYYGCGCGNYNFARPDFDVPKEHLPLFIDLLQGCVDADKAATKRRNQDDLIEN